MIVYETIDFFSQIFNDNQRQVPRSECHMVLKQKFKKIYLLTSTNEKMVRKHKKPRVTSVLRSFTRRDRKISFGIPPADMTHW